MCQLFLSTVAAAAVLTSGAFAADLPVRGPAVAPAPIFVAMNWSGFYIGVHAGWVGVEEKQAMASPVFALNLSNSASGFLGGLHAGYNLQSGSIVYGIEGDIDAKSIDKRFTIGAPFVATTGNIRSTWQASLRGRLGVAFDRALLYVTGGIAFSEFSNNYNTGPGAFVQTVSTTRTGWTLGAGVDYAFTSNLIGRLEYRYTDFGSHTHNLNVFLAPPGTSRVRENQHQVTVGISYLFSSGPSAVVAKY